MNLAQLIINDRPELAIAKTDGLHLVRDLAQISGTRAPVTTMELCRRGGEALAQLESLAAIASQVPIDPAQARFAPVISHPEKVICIGLNYRKHAIESGMAIPQEPVVFGKFANALAGSGQDIDVSGLEQLDYEAELGVVIGQRARHVTLEQALDHVLGYCNANDLSERDLQFRSGQWLLGKTPDGFLPLGPYLRLADRDFDPQNLSIRGWHNGELRQDSNTSDMIFSVAEIISYLSRYMTLEPGDVIVTGTPMGVILGFEEKNWMKPGDCYEVEISGLGRLKNQLVSS